MDKTNVKKIKLTKEIRLEIRNQIRSSHTKPLSICFFSQGSFVISYSRSGLSLRDAAPDWLGQEQ